MTVPVVAESSSPTTLSTYMLFTVCIAGSGRPKADRTNVSMALDSLKSALSRTRPRRYGRRDSDRPLSPLPDRHRTPPLDRRNVPRALPARISLPEAESVRARNRRRGVTSGTRRLPGLAVTVYPSRAVRARLFRGAGSHWNFRSIGSSSSLVIASKASVAVRRPTPSSSSTTSASSWFSA
jgi:hypothetical protein